MPIATTAVLVGTVVLIAYTSGVLGQDGTTTWVGGSCQDVSKCLEASRSMISYDVR